MPNIENMVQAVAEADLHSNLVVEAGRCVEVRHRRARCGACMEACPEEAIDVRDNRISLAAERCVSCGSCASVCPTQALQTKNPSAPQLMAFVDQAARTLLAHDAPKRKPMLEFACEHAAASDADARIVVPALPYVDESVLVQAAAAGFKAIALTCCAQPGCVKPTLAAMPKALAAARSLLAIAGTPCTITLRKQKPPESDTASKPTKNAPGGVRAADSITYGMHEYSRRGMISNVASQAKTIVAETAAAELRDKMGQRRAEPTLMQTLTDGQGNLRTFAMPRAESLLNNLYTLNPQPTGTLKARGFAHAEVNAAACSRCGMCARFCPTGALQGEAAPIGSPLLHDPWAAARTESQGAAGSLSFRISDCVGCRLCETACPLHCLRMVDEVDAATIFNLEPVNLLA